MHLRNKPPVLVRDSFRNELEKLSKAALMDMVWSLAGQTCECAEDDDEVIAKIRKEWDIVREYRT